MRIASCVILLLSILVGIHASINQPSHQQTINHVTSHVFRSLDNGVIISPQCNASTIAINQNPTIMAANASIIHDGCFRVDTLDPAICTTTQTSTTMNLNCSCQPILSNTASLYGNVTALGGQVCQLSLGMTITATAATPNSQVFTLNLLQKQTLQQPIVLGNECTDQDIQSLLDTAAQVGANSAMGGLSTTGFTLSYFDIQVSACGFSGRRSGGSSTGSSTGTNSPSSSSTGTGLGSGAGSIVGISWFTELCVMMISSIMMIHH